MDLSEYPYLSDANIRQRFAEIEADQRRRLNTRMRARESFALSCGIVIGAALMLLALIVGGAL
jgi:CHASE3 domain sensor protein